MEEAKNRAEIAYTNLIRTVISARKAFLVSLYHLSWKKGFKINGVDSPEEPRWAGEVVLSGFLRWSLCKLQGMAEISA